MSKNYNQALQTNNSSLEEIITQLNNLPDAGGTTLPTLENEGTASDLVSGKQLIDGEGNIVTGEVPIRTVDDLTISGPVVNVPNGYYSDSVYKPVTVVNLATPEITVSDSGLITAKVTQPLGWTPGATKTATHQLTTETWTLTLEDGSTITKDVCIL